MGSVIVNFKLDEDLKKEFNDVCDELGMSMSTAYTMFVKKVVRDKAIPFEVSIETNSKNVPGADYNRMLERLTAYYEGLMKIKSKPDDAA